MGQFSVEKPVLPGQFSVEINICAAEWAAYGQREDFVIAITPPVALEALCKTEQRRSV